MRAIVALLTLTIFSAVAAETPPARHALGDAVTANIKMPYKSKVISTIPAGNSTYIEVLDGGKTVWLAALDVAVKKGDMINYSDGSVMTNFHSKSLNRTFEKVIFVNKLIVIK
jgi:hypothetical protein